MNPSDLGTQKFWDDLERRSRRPILGGPGTSSLSTPWGATITPTRGRVGVSASTLATTFPFRVTVTKVSEVWVAQVSPGTVNGLTPVVGILEASGGDPMTTTPRPTIELVDGESNYIAIGIKTDLETRDILRLTVESRETLTAVVDTEARLRYAYIPIATLASTTVESVITWRKTSQIRSSHLSYFTAGNADFVW